MRYTSSIAGGCLLLLLGAGILYVSGYMPGTIRCDANGFMHGTGRWLYHYDLGPLMLEEHYVAGRLKLSRWFRPDGGIIAETRWRDGSGIGYYLRQDGTIRAKMQYKNGLAHGQAVYYKEDGTSIDHVAEFRDGQKTEKGE